MKIVYRDHEETINVSFQARGVVRNPEEDGFDNANDNANGGGGENANDGGSDNQGGTQTPETPAAGGSFTIAAGVGADGGGSVVIKKNGAAVEGGSVEATGSDTVVLQAVPESDNFQFMSWSDGNSQNPRTIQPSADMNVTASFLDLSKI